MKEFFFSIICCLSFSISAQDISDISFGTDSTFEIMTWNIEDFPKNGETTVNRVKQVLEAVDVDMICLQEIEDSNTLKLLVSNLDGYDVFIEDGFIKHLAVIYKIGTVNIQDIYSIYTSSTYWNIFPRSPLVIEFKVNNETFVAINNHYKCCGDGYLDAGNLDDEEAKRYEASILLEQFIDGTYPNNKVFLVGDLNDEITDQTSNNVFRPFLNEPTKYRFADEGIALGTNLNWSFPRWPSHLDHILVTNELFATLAESETKVETIRIDDYLEDGIREYDDDISDHRPVVIKFKMEGLLTSVTDLNNVSSDLRIYPNPANEIVNIGISQFDDNSILQIYNANGEIVKIVNIENVSTLELNVSEFSNGIYYIRLINGEKITSIRKIVVVH